MLIEQSGLGEAENNEGRDGCAVQWVEGGAPRQWVAVSLVESSMVEIWWRARWWRGDCRPLVVNDAECRRWEVQAGDRSIYLIIQGVGWVYTQSVNQSTSKQRKPVRL